MGPFGNISRMQNARALRAQDGPPSGPEGARASARFAPRAPKMVRLRGLRACVAQTCICAKLRCLAASLAFVSTADRARARHPSLRHTDVPVGAETSCGAWQPTPGLLAGRCRAQAALRSVTLHLVRNISGQAPARIVAAAGCVADVSTHLFVFCLALFDHPV